MFSLPRRTPFYEQLETRIAELEGMFNAHLHLDRAGTLLDKYFEPAGIKVQEHSAISLHEKHHLTLRFIVAQHTKHRSQDPRKFLLRCHDRREHQAC